jgi:glutathione peroxidase-family protein
MIAVLWFDCQVKNESNVQVHAFQNVAYLIVNAASSKYQEGHSTIDLTILRAYNKHVSIINIPASVASLISS